ncbi:hypothetical protein D9M68_971050 [compost metagenome]
MPSRTSAKAVSTMMPANTVFTSNVPSACRIRYPTPLADPRYSPTTAPTKARPTDVCRLENTQLVADGRYTCRNSWRLRAPSILALSSKVGLTSRTPW